MLDYAMFRSLLWSHQYVSAAEEARRLQAVAPCEIGPVQCLAEALTAMGKYAEALPFYAQSDHAARSDKRVPGQSGTRIWMSCLHWMLGEEVTAIQLMREMVDGILDRSIEFGDLAGAVSQGVLLYYMGITALDDKSSKKALSYLKTRVKRRAISSFPGPVARYYLGQNGFADVVSAATKDKARSVANAIEFARTDLLIRRWLCVALFHDGIKARIAGDERHCQLRLTECFALENPLLEPEWYLARFEVQSEFRRFR